MKPDIGLDLAKFYKQLTGMSESDVSGTSTEISEKSSPNRPKTSTPVAMETSDRYIFDRDHIYLFIYLLNFAIHTDINKWQGHHNSVHQLLWALLKLSNTVNLRIQLNLSQYNITRYNTIRYNTCTIQYITTEHWV